MINTGKITYALRALGLMHLYDVALYRYMAMRNKQHNEQFKKDHPDFVLPPDYMMFESFRLDYKRYYESGKNDAAEVKQKLQQYTDLSEIKFLDWGCGPARIVRHLPGVLGPDSKVYGTDYNANTIAWCSENIKNVSFSLNGIDPPLSYEDNFFDVVMGISIFTHLSESKHYEWIEELARVIKKGGILYITTHGNACIGKLTDNEKAQFHNGQLIARGNVKEGHRVYLAYHPGVFMKKLTGNYFDVLDHYQGKVADWGIEQDQWVLKKK